jgi:hypothetical protein
MIVPSSRSAGASIMPLECREAPLQRRQSQQILHTSIGGGQFFTPSLVIS